MIVLKPTQRGLLRGEFEDRYGKQCNIQESSLATDEAIWLGIEAVSVDGVDYDARMHLTKQQVRDLLPILRYFARNGNLGHDDPKEVFPVGLWVVGVGETNQGVEGRVIESVEGQYMTVQDNRSTPPEGKIVCLWENALLVWEPMEMPTSVSRYERLLRPEEEELV
jgi:hypothetical protein